MAKKKSVSTTEFDMKQFMQYLADNSDKIQVLKIERVDVLAVCEVIFKDEKWLTIEDQEV